MKVQNKSGDGHEIDRALVTLLLVLTHSSLADLSIYSVAAPCHNISFSSTCSGNLLVCLNKELL